MFSTVNSDFFSDIMCGFSATCLFYSGRNFKSDVALIWSLPVVEGGCVYIYILIDERHMHWWVV